MEKQIELESYLEDYVNSMEHPVSEPIESYLMAEVDKMVPRVRKLDLLVTRGNFQYSVENCPFIEPLFGNYYYLKSI